MRINVVCVGKIKEKFYTQAVDEYSKRLSRYCKLDIVELADEKTPDNASNVVNEQIKNKEGERILSVIKDDAYVCALAIEGKMLFSKNLLIVDRVSSSKSSGAFPSNISLMNI